MILDTVGEYVDQARVLLQDTVAPYRFTDPELIAALNLAVLEGLRLRPDLFYGATIPTLIAKTDSAGFIAPAYRVAFLHYVIGHTEFRESEQTEEQRASTFAASFARKLTTMGV